MSEAGTQYIKEKYLPHGYDVATTLKGGKGRKEGGRERERGRKEARRIMSPVSELPAEKKKVIFIYYVS